MKKPQYFIIGAQKCATTWLYQCLKEHPQLFLPAHKRERFYLGGAVYRQKGKAWFYSLFAKAAPRQKICDVSVEYLFDPDCPVLLQREIRQPKFIVCLRNPVDRALSAFFWYQRRRTVPRKAADKFFDGLLADLQDNTLSATGRDLLMRGFYHEQIWRYLQIFPPAAMQFILYDSIVENPQRVLKSVFQFLQVDARFVPKNLTARPKININNPFTLFLDLLFSRLGVPGKAADRLNQVLAETTKTRPAGLGRKVRRKLAAVYRPHNERLIETLNNKNVVCHADIEECIRNWT